MTPKSKSIFPQVSRADNIRIRPTSKEIKPTVESGVVTFTISQTGQYSVEIDGRHNILTIFANAPVTPLFLGKAY